VARAKSVQVRAEDDKRATWLETRELQQNFKDLVYLSLQQVSSICRFLYFPSLTSRWPFIAVKAVLCDCFVCYIKSFIVSCVLLHHAIFNNSAYSCRHVCLKIPYFIASIASSNNYILVFVGLVLKKSRKKLECGPMPNLMVALPNIGGALCSTPQSLADAHY